MFDTDFTRDQVSALLSAMLTVAPDRREDHQPSLHFAQGIRDHLFQMPDLDLDSLPESTPLSFTKAFPEPHKARLAVQILIVMPYLSGQLHDDDIERVDHYAQTIGFEPSALRDLKNIRHGRIKRAMIDYSRRAVDEFLPAATLNKTKAIIREIHSLVGDAKRAVEFEALSECSEGTLGKTIHTFYRARGFSFPGEKGNIGESAVEHDCVHILTGINTDMAGEIAVGAVEAAMINREVGWEMAAEVLIDFHLGIAWTLPSGIKAGTMNFDPELFSQGLAIGRAINIDLIKEWNYQDDLNTCINRLRKRFNIEGVNIINMPAPGKDTNAKTVYWNF